MRWIAATVTGSNMHIIPDQYASSRDLKQLTISAVTTHSGELFHRSTTLKLKKACLSSSLEHRLFNLKECPLVLVLKFLIRGLPVV